MGPPGTSWNVGLDPGVAQIREGPLRIATWNVNSVRAREARLLAWLESKQPDVLCLQEIKVVDDGFPAEAVAKLGYHAAVYGQKTYNGVAILSRTPPEDVTRGFADGDADPQARFVGARIPVPGATTAPGTPPGAPAAVRVYCAYFPNGGEVGSEKWAYKLAWMERLRAFLDRAHRADEAIALCGDFNVAPEDRDVANPESWKDTVLCHPDARAALARIAAFGLEDVFRRHRPEPGLFSWWDYRNLGFPKNDGLRIDHVYATPALAARSTAAEIDRNERKGKQPSDHAPVIAEFAG
jgi:exodeoxyribonuclease-3